jgi:hypothetical protein
MRIKAAAADEKRQLNMIGRRMVVVVMVVDETQEDGWCVCVCVFVCVSNDE